MVEDRLLERFHGNEQVGAIVAEVEGAVTAGELSPSLAADRLLSAFL